MLHTVLHSFALTQENYCNHYSLKYFIPTLHSYTSLIPECDRNLASTWDKDLMHRQGIAIGLEARGKGVNIWMGPYVNMLRAPQGGRIWEGSGQYPVSISADSCIALLFTFKLYRSLFITRTVVAIPYIWGL